MSQPSYELWAMSLWQFLEKLKQELAPKHFLKRVWVSSISYQTFCAFLCDMISLWIQFTVKIIFWFWDMNYDTLDLSCFGLSTIVKKWHQFLPPFVLEIEIYSNYVDSSLFTKNWVHKFFEDFYFHTTCFAISITCVVVLFCDKDGLINHTAW